MKQSKIGGQAVIEGVMMRGESAAALSVRDDKNNIRIKTWRLKPKTKWNKIPIVRGVVNFVQSIKEGTGTLMDSANVFGEEEPSKFEKWLAKKFKIDLLKVVMAIAMVLGLALAIGLFIVAPALLAKLICGFFNIEIGSSGFTWIEAGIKLLILFGYMLSTSLLGDIKRVYMYHGAEHKTINCYERELELTVENVKSCPKFHNRCGTTFLFFVVLVSIIVFSVVKIDDILVRILVKIAFLPLVAGLAYELLMFVAKTKCWIFYPLRLPGMLLQKITTSEPDDKMIEVAITSFKAVLELDADRTLPTYDRLSFKYISEARKEGVKILDKAKVCYDADIEWIICEVTNLKRSQLHDTEKITQKQYDDIIEMVKKRATGKPLWHIIGKCDFYGFDLICDERGLIPRPETEQLCQKAIILSQGKESCLDMCTGSGAIGIVMAKKTNMKVTAVDLMDNAISLATENAERVGADIEIIKSNMFENLEGRKFDMILSNPPYIKRKEIETLEKEVKDYEPISALDGGEDGLDFYRILSKNAKNFLNPNGVIIMEIGYDQGEDVARLFEGYENVEVQKDFQGKNRIIIGRIN